MRFRWMEPLYVKLTCPFAVMYAYLLGTAAVSKYI